MSGIFPGRSQGKSIALGAIRGALLTGGLAGSLLIWCHSDPEMGRQSLGFLKLGAVVFAVSVGAAGAVGAAVTSRRWLARRADPLDERTRPRVIQSLLLASASGTFILGAATAALIPFGWCGGRGVLIGEGIGAISGALGGLVGGPLTPRLGTDCRWSTAVAAVVIGLAVSSCVWLVAGPDPCPSGVVNWCNYEKIRNGMSESEVAEILGRGGEVQPPGFGPQERDPKGNGMKPTVTGDRVLKWENTRGGVTVWVGFSAGKVCSKYCFEVCL